MTRGVLWSESKWDSWDDRSGFGFEAETEVETDRVRAGLVVEPTAAARRSGNGGSSLFCAGGPSGVVYAKNTRISHDSEIACLFSF